MSKITEKSSQIVAYFRVSTSKQGKSGLGLEAQQAAVERYAISNGQAIIESFTEVESGKNSDRPQLAAALEYCRQMGSTLVVAKLDRLARNVLFIAKLMEAKVDFIACDMPMANKLTLHLMAAFAEFEADMISKRTKEGLAAAKARGTKLGASRDGYWEGRSKDAPLFQRRSTKPIDTALVELIQSYVDGGKTYAQIAEILNGQGKTTPTGKSWAAGSVYHAAQRAQTVAT